MSSHQVSDSGPAGSKDSTPVLATQGLMARADQSSRQDFALELQHQEAQAPISPRVRNETDEQTGGPADTPRQWIHDHVEVDSAIGSIGGYQYVIFKPAYLIFDLHASHVASMAEQVNERKDTNEKVKRTSTTSLSSSIYDSVEEFGRTYHAYKFGKYNLPNDEKEQDRLDLQHAVCMELFGRRLAIAPIEHIPLHNALDIATGTGVWAIDFADAHPSCSVLGTDLSPIQPALVPPNCRFLVDDAEDEWQFGPALRFDYVHARAVFTCFRDPRRVIRSAFAALAPGGFLEIQDPTFPLSFADPQPPPDSPTVRWMRLVAESAAKSGSAWVNCYEYREWFRQAGFVDVHVEPFFFPVGPWRKDDDGLRRLGAAQLHNWLEAVDGVSPRMLGKLGWQIEEIKVLVAQVRAEFLSGKLSAWGHMVSTWGRKPQAAGVHTEAGSGDHPGNVGPA